jgi:hypothetical protein
MSYPTINDLEKNVAGLMDVEDELGWQHEGLFSRVDALGGVLGPSFHLEVDLMAKPGFTTTNLTYDQGPSGTQDSVFTKHITSPLVAQYPSQTEKFQSTAQASRLNEKVAYPSERVRFTHKNPHSTGIQRKAWKTNRKVRKMVLGSDVGLEEACRFALYGVVGRFAYSYLSNVNISVWIKEQWAPLLGYSSDILYLTKGWMGFICKTPEDATRLLENSWVNGGSNLMLKRWRVDFDPLTKHFQFRHLWVLLPGLPIHLWNAGALRAIGDSLGKFISLTSSS